MFSAPTTTDPEPKSLGNIQAGDLNSNQQIVPVPYLAGRRFIAGLSLTDVYNVVTKAEKRQTTKGGKGGGSGTPTYIDYGDFGLAFCMGGRMPVEAVFKVIVNTDIVWESADGLWFGAAEYLDITVANYGLLRIYKGSYTQPVDALLTPRGARPGTIGFDDRRPQTWPYRDPDLTETTYLGLPSGEAHPIAGHYDAHSAYRPVCYGIFHNWRLGRNPAPAPNIKVELQRSVPWFAGFVVDRAATGLDATASGVNPVGVAYDILTDPVFGLGYTDAELYRAGWENALAAQSWLLIAPLLENFSPAKTLLANLISPWSTDVKSYVDGYLRERDGLIDLGVFDHGLIDTNSLPLLTDDDLDGEPDPLPTSYDDVATTFTVSYSDKDHFYQRRPQKYDDPSARRQVGKKRPVTDNREWIVAGDIAKRWVTEAGRIRTLPGQSGPIPVKREWLDNAPMVGGGTYGQVREGDRFLWNSASKGLSQLLWIIETEWPEDRSGQTTLHVENERGFWPSLYIPPPDTSLGDFVIQPVDIVTHRIVELPSGELKSSANKQIAIFALRTDAAMRGFHVHTSVLGTTFDLVSERNHFAIFGKIKSAAYGVTATPDTVTGMIVDLYGADLDQLTPQTDSQRDDNTWLAFTAGGEIMSVGDKTALGSGRFKIFPKRGLYGTAIASHAIDTDVWFIRRADLIAIENANFIAGATRYFKLQAFTQTQDFDLASATSFPFVFGSGSAVSIPIIAKNALKRRVYAAPSGQQEQHLHMIWDYVRDQEIVSFEAQVTGPGYTDLTLTPPVVGGFKKISSPEVDWIIPPWGIWSVSVRAFNRYGEASAWETPDGVGIVASVSVYKWRLTESGALEGWNPTQSLWFPYGVDGTAGNEVLGIVGAGHS